MKRKPVINSDFWEDLDPGKRHFYALIFLFILPLFLFHASVIGGKQYMGHDVIQWRAGAESLMQHKVEYEETAHWATNMFSGMPATTISHPPQIVNLDNTVLAYFQFIYPAAEMWILLFGAYIMFILMGLKPLPAVFGAIIIGFSTYIPIIIGAGHNAKFLAYIYIPWLYNGYFLLASNKTNKGFALFIFALALTLHLRAYHPQVTYFFLFPLATLFIYDLIQSIRSRQTKPFIFFTGYLIAAASVAVLITVQLYWSTLEYSSFSMRGGSEIAGTGGLSRDYAFAWSQGWGELLTLLIPGAYGGSELYWGPKSFTSGPHYAGALAFLFFIIGAVKSNHRLKWVFLGPGIATLFFSLGEYFGALNNLMFDYFPLFDKFRVPEMWLMVTVFCFGAVAAFGFDWVMNHLRANRTFKDWSLSVYIASAIAIIAIFAGFQLLTFEKPGERQNLAGQIALQNNVPADDPRVSQAVSRMMQTQLIPQREELARGDTVRFAGLLFLGLFILFLTGTKKVPLSAGFIALCVILAYDLISIDSRYLSERSLVDQNLSREAVIGQQERDIDRFIQENIMHEEGWPHRVIPFLDNPFNNAIPAYFFPSAGGYSGAKLSYYQDLIDSAFISSSGELNVGVISMLNVKYITLIQPLGIDGLETVYEGMEGFVLENRKVLPKAFFVDSVKVLNTQREVLQQLSSGFDPSFIAYAADHFDIPAARDTSASVIVNEYNANRIELEIYRGEPGFLVLSEIWYPPGWRAMLNGEEIPIIRSNYVLRGFQIPPGNHKLEMVLEPVWYETGNRLALLGTILLTGFGIFGLIVFYREQRKNSSQVDNQGN